jgi:hypothetical protein
MVSGPGSNNNSVEYRLGPVQGSLEFAANWGSLHKVRAVLFVRQRAARECPVVLIDRCKTDTHLLPCRVRGSGPGMVRARRWLQLYVDRRWYGTSTEHAIHSDGCGCQIWRAFATKEAPHHRAPPVHGAHKSGRARGASRGRRSSIPRPMGRKSRPASLPLPRVASHRLACSPQTAKGSRRGVGAGPEPCSPRHHMSVCVRGAYRGVAALRWRKKRVIVPPVRGGARTAAARLLLPTHTKRSESDMRVIDRALAFGTAYV